ncbi:hypothetical protein [Paraburkholderia fungorum]|uniref:hypothetical protein n=1 Tax=Paraburkholderia fungorum TaxID=134537 RepID=UPI001C1E92CB|nr:hypothetical protein [Paraburkholderia fungorum]MBU7437012.1 hypothetical protein [Paraburkholderia fungorum]
MKFNTQIKVLGMKSNKGMMDNGQTYDSTKVYVETALDDTKGNAKGFAVAEYTLGLSEEFGKYKHLPFPFMADATVEIVTTGKAQKTQLVELKPIELAKKAA